VSVHVVAYAKLNLSLRVLGLRADGYHEIVSEVQTIDLADRLTIDLVANGVHVESDLAVQGEDIVERAAAALLHRKKCDRGVRIRVEKVIPVGAGLGGGSSDAAAVLGVLDRVTPPGLSFDALCEIGAGIGSDVPLFLHGGRVRMTGRGEHVKRLPETAAKYFVVLVPPIRCATGLIYSRWDAIASASREKRGAPLRRGENDLLHPALDVHPALVPYHDGMQSLGADYCGMSGSGSSFYAAFDERTVAGHACASLKQRFDSADTFVCRPTGSGHCVLGSS
jgi:4-diphosphocytidyl-2-C-methyl-D-erythritol kinase